MLLIQNNDLNLVWKAESLQNSLWGLDHVLHYAMRLHTTRIDYAIRLLCDERLQDNLCFKF